MLNINWRYHTSGDPNLIQLWRDEWDPEKDQYEIMMQNELTKMIRLTEGAVTFVDMNPEPQPLPACFEATPMLHLRTPN